MNQKLILPIRGTQDFYPENYAFLNWLYQKVKKVSLMFGYQEYEGPMLEPLELYAAKSGEELVKKQAFCWQDKKGKKIALRPELTPTLARMVAQKSNQLTFPLRWFSFGRFFRYEKPQKGRGREFFQWNLDIIGSDSLIADAEVIAVSTAFLKELGINPKQARIKISDRQVLTDFLANIQIAPQKFSLIFKLIDKKEKIGDQVFLQELKRLGLNNQQKKAIEKFLLTKKLPENALRLKQLLEILKQMEISEYVEYEPMIVRGLDYYTSTVFEAWSTSGNLRALWGGGRYDNLIKDVGARQKIPGVGFAAGVMVIEELLKLFKQYPFLNPCSTLVLVTVFNQELLQKSIKVANFLRKNNIKSELYLDQKKIDNQLKYADRRAIPWVIIIGPDEAKKNRLILRNMIEKTQEELSLEKVVKKLKSQITRP